WEHLIDLSRRQGVTIFVSTHFMNEAARCDRVALMDTGRVLATDAPAGLVAARQVTDMEEAFISYLEEAKGPETPGGEFKSMRLAQVSTRHQGLAAALTLSLRRLFACILKETLELRRDLIRMGFALLGTSFLMLILGTGISFDVDNLTFALLDRDNSHVSRAYLEELRGSRYFVEKPPLGDTADIERRLQKGDVKAAIEIPPHFGRDLKKGHQVMIGVWIDGANPFRAETIRGYLNGVHSQFLADLAREEGSDRNEENPVTIETRFRYNQDFDSVFAMVPGTVAMLLALIPAILMALAVVREKELGSITNLYVTPLGRLEFLIGKQIPYVGIGIVNFLLMCLMAIFIFGVPIKGNFLTLFVGVVVYLVTTTGYGMFISTFCTSQIAAIFGTAILTALPAIQFSGMIAPVSSMTGLPALFGRAFPMTYFLTISVGTFTKSLGFAPLVESFAMLLLFIPALIGLSFVFLRKQQS
ncbi:MAG: ABC transporter permease, partial [Beijerinckiaceae bacterium]